MWEKEEFSERLRLGALPAVTTPDHPLQGGFEDVAKSVGGSSLCLLIASLTLEHPTRAAQELVQWLGFATFELFLHLLALLVFSMLVALRADKFTPMLSWWLVFVPLFAADGLSTYFTAIVSIRLYQENEKRLAVLRLLWVLTVLSLKLVCEVLLCQKLAEQEQARDLWFGLIVSPLFILLQLLMIRACRVN
ncbi:Transmembrane protein 203 [Larimichthys crocea]|uniref:Transmembrane protein 203 n=1 Tax=Larimichthys crocea TaxID=215358 RepID=A0A6G0I063_LARCR|nr:Transmembrane protein 203 [Larimichthys crocea]